MNAVYVSLILGLLVAGCILLGWSLGRSYQKTKCRKCSAQRLERELKRSADILLRVTKEIGIISELQHEKAKREELMDFIHNLFFFREFKKPEAVEKHLESRMAEAAEATLFVDENKAISRMYGKILKDIRPEWLEEK